MSTAAGALISELEDAIQANHADKRTSLLRRVTDLFVRGADVFAEEHVAVFDGVLTRLAEGMEAKARAELSDRLAPLAKAPVKVVEALGADDDVAVASPVLTQSARLGDAKLVEIASTKSQGHMLAISRRSQLGCSVTDVLVERGDGEVVRTVAANPGAQFSNTGFNVLVGRSRHDELLAEVVGMRRDLPPDRFDRLIEAASAAVRSRLAYANPDLAAHIREIIASITEQTKQAAEKGRDYTAAREAVRASFVAKTLGENEVAAFAKQGQFEETAVAFALICGLPIEAVERAFVGKSSEPVLILAKAAGFSWDTAKVVLRLCAGGVAMSAADRENAETQFIRLQTATAQRVLRFYKVRETTAAKP